MNCPRWATTACVPGAVDKTPLSLNVLSSTVTAARCRSRRATALLSRQGGKFLVARRGDGCDSGADPGADALVRVRGVAEDRHSRAAALRARASGTMGAAAAGCSAGPPPTCSISATASDRSFTLDSWLACRSVDHAASASQRSVP